MENFIKTENETESFEEEECNFYDFEDLDNDPPSEKDPLNLEDVKKEDVFVKEEIILEESNHENSYGNSNNIEILGIENTHTSRNCEENDSEFIGTANLIHTDGGIHPGNNKTFYYSDNMGIYPSSNVSEKSSSTSEFPDFEASTQENHMRLQAKEKGFMCSGCDRMFLTQNKLSIHMRVHTGEKPFRCSACNKSFSQSHNLYRHIRLHTGEKRFKCSACNKLFSTLYDLKKHTRVHTGEKPFKCSECNKSFSRSDHLDYHMRVHTGEKPFTCSKCNKSFSKSSNLYRHIRSHTGK